MKSAKFVEEGIAAPPNFARLCPMGEWKVALSTQGGRGVLLISSAECEVVCALSMSARMMRNPGSGLEAAAWAAENE